MMIYHAPNNDFSINIKVAASADKKDKSLLLTQPIDNTINIETNCRPKVTMLNRLSSTRTKSEKRVHFHAHFHASRMMLTDVSCEYPSLRFLLFPTFPNSFVASSYSSRQFAHRFAETQCDSLPTTSTNVCKTNTS